MFKIFLKWKDRNEETHVSEMDYVFKSPSPNTFKELVSNSEKLIENLYSQYGDKEWLYLYMVYEKIYLYKDDKLVAYWSIGKYLRERRKR